LPVDIVLPWVDETDLSWLRDKKNYQEEVFGLEATGSSRFRDYGTLKYVFRSMEKYIPWINNVFFVTTNHQYPKWLNTEHSKLKLVDHSDFIPEKYLPTFNSSVIISNVFRIPGLSQQFIITNDDIFFNQTMNETDFFQDGLPVCSSEFDPIHPMGNFFSHIVLNDLELVAKHFSKQEIVAANFRKFYTTKIGIRGLAKNLLLAPYKDLIGFKNFHLAAPYLKSTFEELMNVEGIAYEKSLENKFRSINDVNEWAAQYWQVCTGDFIPTNSEKMGSFLEISDLSKIQQEVTQSSHKILCINDVSNLDDLKFDKIKTQVNRIFENKFPSKSSFEV